MSNRRGCLGSLFQQSHATITLIHNGSCFRCRFQIARLISGNFTPHIHHEFTNRCPEPLRRLQTNPSPIPVTMRPPALDAPAANRSMPPQPRQLRPRPHAQLPHQDPMKATTLAAGSTTPTPAQSCEAARKSAPILAPNPAPTLVQNLVQNPVQNPVQISRVLNRREPPRPRTLLPKALPVRPAKHPRIAPPAAPTDQ